MGKQLLVLAVILAVVFAAGTIGVPFTARAMGAWYPEIAKPAWTPPNWVFAPAWTLLYVMMAVAAWLVWRRGGFASQGPALGLFMIQQIGRAHV